MISTTWTSSSSSFSFSDDNGDDAIFNTIFPLNVQRALKNALTYRCPNFECSQRNEINAQSNNQSIVGSPKRYSESSIVDATMEPIKRC